MSSPALVRLRDTAFGARTKLYFKVFFKVTCTLTEMTEHIVSSSGSARASEHPLISPPLVLDLPLVLQLELDMGTKGNSNLPWEIPDTSGQMKGIWGAVSL